eukprot:COSAG01_NODE_340_length_18638_cov_56.516505_17_plen_256_part_00
MAADNAVRGVPTCTSRLLKNKLLQWNFSGYVTSDSDSLSDAWNPVKGHGYYSSPEGACCGALTTGWCDVNSGDTFKQGLPSAVRQGLCTSQDVDAALRRTLRVRFELGLFDSKSSNPTQAKLTSLDASAVGTAASAALSLDAARQSIVLLRNDGAADGGAGVLPFGSSAAAAAGHPAIRRIAVIGALANATLPLMGTHYRGYACGNANKDDLSCVPTIGEAFAAALGGAGVAVEIVPGSEIDAVIPGGVAAAGIS